jgi:hypothetical protein
VKVGEYVPRQAPLKSGVLIYLHEDRQGMAREDGVSGTFITTERSCLPSILSLPSGS